MVQGTGLPFHCSLLNRFCPWTNSNSIYQHYLAENLNAEYIAVNLSGQIRRHELIQVSSCSQVCWYGYTWQSWCGEFGGWSTHGPHVDPSQIPPTEHMERQDGPECPLQVTRSSERVLSPWEVSSRCADPSVVSPHPLQAHSCWWEQLWSSATSPQCPPAPPVPTETCSRTSSIV